MDHGELDDDGFDPDLDPRTLRRLARSRQRRAQEALEQARAGLVVSMPPNDGWGPQVTTWSRAAA